MTRDAAITALVEKFARFAVLEVQHHGDGYRPTPEEANLLTNQRLILSRFAQELTDCDGPHLDMLQVDRLNEWARNIRERGGSDITFWGNPAFVADECERIAKDIEAQIKSTPCGLVDTLSALSTLDDGGSLNGPSRLGASPVKDTGGEIVQPLSALGGRPETGWQPIATAPKDGQYILIGWFEFPGQDSMHVAFWNSLHQGGCWCQSHSAFTTDKNWQPTHWQPLPSPPLQEQP